MNDTQRGILQRAAMVLLEQDKLRREVRENEAALRKLCREYDKSFGLWGCAPHHLRLAVENHGLLDKAV